MRGRVVVGQAVVAQATTVTLAQVRLELRVRLTRTVQGSWSTQRQKRAAGKVGTGPLGIPGQGQVVVPLEKRVRAVAQP